jgi:flagellar motor switch protein FliM
MEPLKGSAIFEMDPSVTFAVIDRLFGGLGEPAKISRELTDIELSVMESVMASILGNLRAAWSNVIDLMPRLGNLETNPQFAQIVPPNDMIILITLETKIGDVEGMCNLVIPYITIEPVLEKFSAQYMYGLSTDKTGIDFVKKEISKSGKIKKYAQFNPGKTISINDVRSFKKGDRIYIDPETEYSALYGNLQIKKTGPVLKFQAGQNFSEEA